MLSSSRRLGLGTTVDRFAAVAVLGAVAGFGALACSSSGRPSGSGAAGAGGGAAGSVGFAGNGAGGLAAGGAPAGSGGGGNSAGSSGSAGSGGAATGGTSGVGGACVEGLTCSAVGSSCVNSDGATCACGGPPGSSFLTCNSTNAAGASGTGGAPTAAGGSGGTSGSGGQASGGAAGASSVTGEACAGSAPLSTGNGDYQITVDAAQKGAAWSRFYEQGVACDHANTLLSTAYGRSAQAAIKKGHYQAGFQYVRFHGALDDDIGVYSENNGAAVYTWTKFDQVYDAIKAAGMRPVLEISFTPSQMASANTILTNLWYNNRSPNISKPKDWTKWEAFMTAIVQHLETRYGAAEIRNWYFEVWNEPSWMYAGTDSGYNELYMHTSKGLAAADNQIRVGGPAGSAGESPSLISNLVSYVTSNNLKLDFISFHNYSNDNNGAYASPGAMLSFYDSLRSTIAAAKFTGTIINDEFGSSYDAVALRDSEVSASFIAKTVHLIGTASKAGPPAMYAWWAISDLYEEFNTGTNTAYRPGNFGLLLKGDPTIPASFDVAKPAFNAFRLLHLMGDVQIPAMGGTTSDGVNAAATVSADGSAVQVLVYNHVSGGTANSSTSSQVKLTVNNIPGTGPLTVHEYVLDRTHANSYQTWLSLGSPSKPSSAQWTQISSAADLCYYPTTAAGTSWTVTYPQSVYGVTLFVLSR